MRTENFAKAIKQAAKMHVRHANEHHPRRALMLRAEIAKHGKPMHELTACELVRINQFVDEKLT